MPGQAEKGWWAIPCPALQKVDPARPVGHGLCFSQSLSKVLPFLIVRYSEKKKSNKIKVYYLYKYNF